LTITAASPPEYIPLVIKVFLLTILGSLILMLAFLLKNRGKNTSPKSMVHLLTQVPEKVLNTCTNIMKSEAERLS
jgi:hypothetical protein